MAVKKPPNKTFIPHGVLLIRLFPRDPQIIRNIGKHNIVVLALVLITVPSDYPIKAMALLSGKS